MTSMTPTLQAGEDAAAAVAKTENRVKLSAMHEKISSVEYVYPQSAPTLTIAVVLLNNGFSIIGESACADPKNFNKELGQEMALANAVRKIWPLEGYLLREKLSFVDKVTRSLDEGVAT